MHLVNLQWVRAIHPDGTHETAVILNEAQALTYGKKIHAIFPACTTHWKTLRSCGHTGITIEHYVWDRMGITALERMLRQWHIQQQAAWGT